MVGGGGRARIVRNGTWADDDDDDDRPHDEETANPDGGPFVRPLQCVPTRRPVYNDVYIYTCVRMWSYTITLYVHKTCVCTRPVYFFAYTSFVS